MWSRITGNKSNGFEDDKSHSSRHRSEDGQPSRRAPGFSTSSKLNQVQSRDEIRDRRINPTPASYSATPRSPYPGTASAPIASSYATAGSNQIDDTSVPPSVVRNTSIADNMPITKPRSGGMDQDSARDRKAERRRERPSSKDREHGVDRGDRGNRKVEKRDKRDREDGGPERDTRPRRSGTGFSDDYDPNRETSRGVFDDQIGGPGFTQFPGQYDSSIPGSRNGLLRATHMSDRVPDQFPGQFPMQSSGPYRPPTSSIEGGPGLASEYYNDHGESVSQQPGVRPHPSTIILAAEPHLQAAAPIAAPPPEPSLTGGVGAAASFYSGGDDIPFASSTKPPSSSRPGKQTGSSRTDGSPSYPSSVVTMGGGVQGDATGITGQTGRPQSSTNDHTYYQQMPNSPFPDTHQSSSEFNQSINNHSASAPILPTLGVAAAGATADYLMSEHTSSLTQSSNNNQPMTGAASEHAASSYGRPPSYSGAYHDSVTSHNHSSRPGKPPLKSSNNSMYVAGTASTVGLAAAAYNYNNHSSGHPSSTGKQYPSGYIAQRHRHRHLGPLDKFVDFWKDPDGVAQFEEYTEYIGVCKDCFAPGSSPRDAPRKHYYRKRRSNGRLGSNARVDKDSRYGSSDSESRRRKKSSWLATGIAGYGLAKVGESLFNQKNGSEEGYGVSYDDTRQSRERLQSPDRRSSVSYGVTRRSSDIRSRDRNETGITSDGKVYKKDSYSSSFGGPPFATYETCRPGTNEHRSRSTSRNRKSGLAEAALGVTLGTSVELSSGKYRQCSPGKAYSTCTRRSKERSPQRESRSRYPSSTSNVDQNSSRKEDLGLFGGFFGSTGNKPQRSGRKSKKDRGFFSFSNASSSSSDSHKGFSSKRDRHKGSNKPRNQDTDRRKAEAAILGIGAVAVTIAANESRKHHKSGAKADLVAVKESKVKHTRKPHEHRTKQSETSSYSSEDQWESTTENDYYSADSALAYGLSRRESRDSLNSESSGTNKWNWRWGSKKKKKKKKKRNVAESPSGRDKPIAAGLGTAASEGTTLDVSFTDGGYRYENSLDSVIGAPLRNVYPIATSDPTHYDADNQSSVVSSNFPVMASRPAPIPLQQPQPIVPISNAVYSSQPTYGHSSSAPSRYPVSTQGFSQTNAPTIGKYGEIIKDVDMPGSFPTSERPSNLQDSSNVQKFSRRDASPTQTNSDKIRASRRVPTREEPASVRFDLAKEREDQDRRQKRRERKAEDDRTKLSGLRETEQQAEMAKAELVEPIRPSHDIDRTKDLNRNSTPRRSDGKKPRRESQPSWFAPVAAVVAASTVIGGVESIGRDPRGIEMQNLARGEDKIVSQKSEESIGISAEDFYAANRKAKLIRQAAAKVKKPPSPAHDSYADYFVPPDLPSKTKEKAPILQRTDDEVTGSYPIAEIVTIEPRSRFPNPPDFDYAEDKDLVVYPNQFPLPWTVPDLHLIDPTPPHSYAGSIRSNASPIILPKHVPVAEEKPRVRPRTGSKVTWGDDETHKYDVITPLEPREEFVDEDNTVLRQDEDRIQRIVKVEDRGQTQSAESIVTEASHMPGEFGDDLEFAATLAAGLEDTGFNPSIVVDNPTFRRRESPPGSERATFYIRPFAETITDLGLDSPDTEGAPLQQGYIEGELPPTPGEEVERPMPGAFDENPKPNLDRKSIDEAAVRVDESEESSKDERVISPTNDVPEELKELVTSGKKVKSKSKKSNKWNGKDTATSSSTTMNEENIHTESSARLNASQKSYESPDDRDIENVMVEALEMKGLGNESSTLGQPSPFGKDEMSNDQEDGTAHEISRSAPEHGEMTEAFDLLQEDEWSRKKHKKKAKDGNNVADDVASAAVAAVVESRKGSKTKSKKGKKGDLREVSSKPTDSLTESGLALDQTKEASFEDFEEPNRKSKKSKDRKSTPDEQDGRSLMSQISTHPSKEIEQDETYGHSRKSKDRKKRQSRESGLKDETGRSTHDLPAKVYMPASLGYVDECAMEKLLTDAKDIEIPQIEEEVAKGSEYPINRDIPKSTDVNDSVSFLGERPEILKPPDRGPPEDVSSDPVRHTHMTSASTVNELASTDQDHSAPQGAHVSPLVIVDAKDLPPLPASRPDSPTASISARTRRLSSPIGAESPQRSVTYSPTAIPFHFRKPPASPGFARTSSSGFPVSSSPSSVAFGIRPKSRPTSTEFKSNEFRPLWLVERHSWREEPLAEEYPSLPSSHATSRSSSVHDVDEAPVYDATENTAYVEGDSILREVAEMSLNTTHRNVPLDFLDSQQTTPTAASFHSLPEPDSTTQSHSLLPTGPFDHGLSVEHRQLISSSHAQDLNAEDQLHEFPSHDAIDEKVDSDQEVRTKLQDAARATSLPEPQSRSTVIEQEYSGSQTMTEVAAIGAAVPAGAASSPDSGDQCKKLVDRGDTEHGPKDAGDEIASNRPALQRVISSIDPFDDSDIAMWDNARIADNEMGQAREKTAQADSNVSTGPSVMSAEERRRIEENDTQDAVESWFAPSSPKKVKKDKKGRKKARGLQDFDTTEAAHPSAELILVPEPQEEYPHIPWDSAGDRPTDTALGDQISPYTQQSRTVLTNNVNPDSPPVPIVQQVGRSPKGVKANAPQLPEINPFVKFEDNGSNPQSFSIKTKKSKNKKGLKKSTNYRNEEDEGLATTETSNAGNGTDPAILEESVQALQETKDIIVADPMALNSEHNMSEVALFADTQSPEAYFTPSRKSQKGKKKNKIYLTTTGSYDDPTENQSRDKTSSNVNPDSLVPSLNKDVFPRLTGGSLEGSAIAAASLPLLLSTSADNQTSDEQQGNSANRSGLVDALDLSAGSHSQLNQGTMLGKEDLAVNQISGHKSNNNEHTDHPKSAMVFPFPDQPSEQDLPASIPPLSAIEPADLPTTVPALGVHVETPYQPGIQHAARSTDGDNRESPALAYSTGFAEGTPLPASDDLDPFDVLPPSLITFPGYLEPPIENEEKNGATRESDTRQSRENPLDIVTFPEQAPLPTSDDLDLLDALPESPTTLPDQISLPVVSELDLPDASRKSPIILPGFSTLKAEEDLDNATPQGPVFLPDYAKPSMDRELDTGSKLEDEFVNEDKNPVRHFLSPENTPLPISDDLDILDKLSESQILLPEYSDLAIEKELDTRSIGKDHPVHAGEEQSVHLSMPPEKLPLPISDDLDLLVSLPESPIVLPEYSEVPAIVDFEQKETLEDAGIKDMHIPADFPNSPRGLPLGTEDDVSLLSPLLESQPSGPNHSKLLTEDTYNSVEAVNPSDHNNLTTLADHVIPSEQMPLSVDDDFDLPDPVLQDPVMPPDYLEPKSVDRPPQASRELFNDPHHSHKIVSSGNQVEMLPSLPSINPKDSTDNSVTQLATTLVKESQDFAVENDVPDNTETPLAAIERAGIVPQAADVADEVFAITSKRKKKDKISHRPQPATPTAQEEVEGDREPVSAAAMDQINREEITVDMPKIGKVNEQAKEGGWAFPSKKKDKKGKKQKSGNLPPQSIEAERGSTLESVALPANEDPFTTSESRTETPIQSDTEADWALPAKRKGKKSKKQIVDLFQTELAAGSPSEDFALAPISTKDALNTAIAEKGDKLDTLTEPAAEELWAVPAKKKGKTRENQTPTKREILETPESSLGPAKEWENVKEISGLAIQEPIEIEPLSEVLLRSDTNEQPRDALESALPTSTTEAIQDPEPSHLAAATSSSKSLGEEQTNKSTAVVGTTQIVSKLLAGNTGQESPTITSIEVADPELPIKADNLDRAPGQLLGASSNYIARNDVDRERDDADPIKVHARSEDYNETSSGTPQAATDTAKDVENILMQPDQSVFPISTPQESPITLRLMSITDEITRAASQVPMEQTPSQEFQALLVTPREILGSKYHKLQELMLSDISPPTSLTANGAEVQTELQEPQESTYQTPSLAFPPVSRAHHVDQLLDAARISLPKDEIDDFQEAMVELYTESIESKQPLEFSPPENDVNRFLDASQTTLPEDETDDFAEAIAEIQTESVQLKHVPEFSQSVEKRNSKVAANTETTPVPLEGLLIQQTSSRRSPITGGSPETSTLSEYTTSQSKQDMLEAERSTEDKNTTASLVAPQEFFGLHDSPLSYPMLDEPLESLKDEQEMRVSSEELPNLKLKAGDGSREIQSDSNNEPSGLTVLPPELEEISVQRTKGDKNAEEVLKSNMLDVSELSMPLLENVESDTVPGVFHGTIPATDAVHIEHEPGLQDNLMSDANEEHDIWPNATKEPFKTHPTEDLKALRDVQQTYSTNTKLLENPETAVASDHDAGDNGANFLHKSEIEDSEKLEFNTSLEEPTSIPNPILATDLITQEPDTSVEKHTSDTNIPDEVIDDVPAMTDCEPGISYSLRKTKKDKKKAKKAHDVEWSEENVATRAQAPSAESTIRDAVAVGEEPPKGSIATFPGLPDLIPIPEADAVDPSFRSKKGKKDKKKAQKAQTFDWSEKSSAVQEPTPPVEYVAQDIITPGGNPLEELAKIDEHDRLRRAEEAEPENVPTDSLFSLKKSKKDKKKGKQVQTSDWPEDSPSLQDPTQSNEIGAQDPTILSKEASRALPEFGTPKNLSESVNAEAEPIGSVFGFKKSKKDKKRGKKSLTSDWSDIVPSAQGPTTTDDIAFKESTIISEEPPETLKEDDEQEQAAQDNKSMSMSTSEPVDTSFSLKKGKKDKKKAKRGQVLDWHADSPSLRNAVLPTGIVAQESSVVDEDLTDLTNANEHILIPQIVRTKSEADPANSPFHVRSSKKDKKKHKKGEPLDWTDADNGNERSDNPAEARLERDIVTPSEHTEKQRGSSLRDLEYEISDSSMPKEFEIQGMPSTAPISAKSISGTAEQGHSNPTASTENCFNEQAPNDFAASAQSDTKDLESSVKDLPIDALIVTSLGPLLAVSDHSRNAAYEPSLNTAQSATIHKDYITPEAEMSHEAESQISGAEKLGQSTTGDYGWNVPDEKSQLSKVQHNDMPGNLQSSKIEDVPQSFKFNAADPLPLSQEMTTLESSVSVDPGNEAVTPKEPHGTVSPIYHTYQSTKNLNNGIRDAPILIPQELAIRLATSQLNPIQADDYSFHQDQEVGHGLTSSEIIKRRIDEPSPPDPQPDSYLEENVSLTKASNIANTSHTDPADSVQEGASRAFEMESNDRPASYLSNLNASVEENLQSAPSESVLPREPVSTTQTPTARPFLDGNTISETAEPANLRVASEEYMTSPITKTSKKNRKGKKQQDPVIWEDETTTPPTRIESSMTEGKADRALVAGSSIDPEASRIPEADLTFAEQHLLSPGSISQSISPSSKADGHYELREERIGQGNSWRVPLQTDDSLERTRSTTRIPSLSQQTQSTMGEEHQEELTRPIPSKSDHPQDYFSFDPKPLVRQSPLEETGLEAAYDADAIESIEPHPLVPISTVISQKESKEPEVSTGQSTDTLVLPTELVAHGALSSDDNNKSLDQQIDEPPNTSVLSTTNAVDSTLESQPEHEWDVPSTKKSRKSKKSKKQKFDYDGPDSLSSSEQLPKPEEICPQEVVTAPEFGSDAVSQEPAIALNKSNDLTRNVTEETGNEGPWKTNAIAVAGLSTGFAMAGDLVGKKSEKGAKKTKKGKKDKSKNLWTDSEGQGSPQPKVQEKYAEMPQEESDGSLIRDQTNIAAWEEDQLSSHRPQNAPTNYDMEAQELDLDRTVYLNQSITRKMDPTPVAHRSNLYTENASPYVDIAYYPVAANDENDINRDSALQISDSPIVSDAPSTYHAVRDSGYQDTEASPLLSHEHTFHTGALQQSIPEESHGVEAIHYTKPLSHSPVYDERKDTFNVSVEVDSDYDISLSRPTIKRGRSHSVSQKTQDHQDDFTLPRHKIEPEQHGRLLSSVSDDLRQPSPVDSTTRDRSSMLFQSSPSAREENAQQGAAHAAVIPVEEVEQEVSNQLHEKSPFQETPTQVDPSVLADRAASLAALSGVDIPAEHEYHSLFGKPAGADSDVQSHPRTPFSPGGSSRRRLNAIEYSPEESPLHKHSRALSDVGSPGRGHKSARRTATPQALTHSRVRSPLAASSIQRKRSLISTDDIISNLDWPVVDDENHSVDLDRSRSISRNTNPHRALSRQSNLSPLTGDTAKHRDTEQRSVSVASVTSLESINAIIRTPDHVRSVSGLSHRSSGTPPLRRVDRSVSSDLRAANKQSEAKRQAKLNLAEAEPQIVIPSSSTYDPVKDKGKTRARDMADVYVSINHRFLWIIAQD